MLRPFTGVAKSLRLVEMDVTPQPVFGSPEKRERDRPQPLSVEQMKNLTFFKNNLLLSALEYSGCNARKMHRAGHNLLLFEGETFVRSNLLPSVSPLLIKPPMEPAGQKNRTMAYELTEEEKRVLRECSHESFLYRALPFSVFSMLATQMLIKKGIISTHSKWGSLPKVAFAGVCGYFMGKISYMDKCKEKLLKLENSQLGNLLRKPNPYGRDSQQPSFSNVPSSTEHDQVGQLPQMSKYPVDNYGAIDFPSDQSVPFSSSVGESSPSGITDSPPPEYVPPPEEVTRRRITYDELRSKNREIYEAGMQKSDIISKPTQERSFKKEVKVNKYGDTWEE